MHARHDADVAYSGCVPRTAGKIIKNGYKMVYYTLHLS